MKLKHYERIMKFDEPALESHEVMRAILSLINSYIYETVNIDKDEHLSSFIIRSQSVPGEPDVVIARWKVRKGAAE